MAAVYVTVMEPGRAANSRPVVASIDAVAGLLLVQLPPVVASVSVVVLPVQSADGPEMPAGRALTVNDCIALHPPGMV